MHKQLMLVTSAVLFMGTIAFSAFSEVRPKNDDPPNVASTLTKTSTCTCTNQVLFANFGGDVVDQAPDINLPGGPSGDFLVLNETNGTIRVRSILGDLISKPVELVKFSGGVGSPQMQAHPAQPISSDNLVVSWRSLSRSNQCGFGSIVLRASSSMIIAVVEYRSNGEMTYTSIGQVGPTIPVSYSPDVSQQFEIKVNFTSQTTSLTIDGVPISGFQNVLFGQPASDLSHVVFGSVACDLGVDDISIYVEAACPDLAPELLTLAGDQAIAPGEQIESRITAIVKNIGLVDQVTGTNIGFYLSDDAVITFADRLLLGGIESIDPIPAGGSGMISLLEGLRVPEDYPLGPAWLGMILDLDRLVNECDETNNTYAIPVFIAESCAKLVVLANFNADLVDAPPDGSLPGDPIGDALNIFLPQGSILVRDAIGDLTNKPIQIFKEAGVAGSPGLSIYLPLDQRNHNRYLVRWRMLTGISQDGPVNAVLRGTDEIVITQVKYSFSGFIQYRVGASLLTTPIPFVPNENQVFEITVDFPTQTTSLSIDGFAVPGFQDVAFVNNVSTIARFQISPGGLIEQVYGIDDVSVCVLDCCVGLTGNVDCDPLDIVDIADLTALIDHLFISFTPLCCPEEANIDGDAAGLVDIADLTFLIDHLFINFPPTAACQ